MPIPDMSALSDEELRAAIKSADALLKKRAGDTRQKAIDEAKAILAKAGLSLKDLGAGKPAAKAAAAPPLKKGERVVNPDNPSEVWEAGRGRRPKWVEKALAAKAEVKPKK